MLDQHGLSARAVAGHIGHARPSITQDVYMDRRAAGRDDGRVGCRMMGVEWESIFGGRPSIMR